MAKKTLDQCRTGNDFRSYGEARGGYIDRQTGSHAIMKSPRGGICPIPMHPGEIPTGTRRSIVKQFVAIGLGVLALLGAISLLPVM